jgi:aminoglycoside phosphotransferase (APT) family kinase protein
MTPDPKALQAALTDTLAAHIASPVQINRLQQIPGGASKETWQLEVEVAGGPWQGRHALVMQRQFKGQVKITNQVLDMEVEFAVRQAAYAAGIPTPRPYWFLPDLRSAADDRSCSLGQPAMLVQSLEGETIGRKVVKAPDLAPARANLPRQMGQALAAIHAIELETSQLASLLPAPAPGQTPARTLLRQYEVNLDEIGEPHPALEVALRWLRQNEPPPPERLVLLHGDFRIGNMVVNAQGLSGVLDWEFAHIGDPAQDLGWPFVRTWRFKVDHLRFGGIAPAEPFLQAYSAASGRSIPAERIFYWEVFGNVLWAIVTLNQARRHLSGQEPNLELASLGRMCAEVEMEALSLIK